eukprot:TRINITY_DN6717_c0_g1_i1.p1 TRINITY_DN6717_c0_g1~~TRINITY_DN6717_c0_g1_i1.p1  ORF type:complete len:321 (+),score=51.54 TRINITY_DN6717_c0_g1_i1:72-1034(+)
MSLIEIGNRGLDPKIKQFLQEQPKQLEELTLEEIRYVVDTAPEKRAETLDKDIPTRSGKIKCRFYTPPGTAGPFQVLVWIHGGGWVRGTLDSYNYVCHNLCLRSSIIVISLDYRLAPEFKYPAAVEDCFDAVQWIQSNLQQIPKADASKPIGLAGDSAGGTLSIQVAADIYKTRGRNPLSYIVAIYPWVNLHSHDTTSFTEFGKNHLLTKSITDRFKQYYLPEDVDTKDQKISPLFTDRSILSRFPPTLVLTSECDVLRDEGEAFGFVLSECGVFVKIHRYNGTVHGFFSRGNVLPFSGFAEAALGDVCGFIHEINRKSV